MIHPTTTLTIPWAIRMCTNFLLYHWSKEAKGPIIYYVTMYSDPVKNNFFVFGLIFTNIFLNKFYFTNIF